MYKKLWLAKAAAVACVLGLHGLAWAEIEASDESGAAPAAAVDGERLASKGDARKDDMLRTAIFVRNNADSTLNDSLPMFRDMLSARLTEKGFSIIGSDDVIARFEGHKGQNEGVDHAVSEAGKLVRFEKTEASVDDVLTGASALRIAQMLDANYLVVATLSSIGEERKVFKGEGSLYKSSNEAVIRTLRATIRVLEGNQGGSVYGDTVTVQQKRGGVDRLQVVSDDTNNQLIDDAAALIASNIAKKVERIRDAKVDTLSMAELTLTSNIEGATVELDGAVIGTAPGSFAVKPGLHQIAVSKEWFSTWRRTINVVPNQVINVALERSKEGEARHEESLRVQREDEYARKRGDAEIAVAKEQSEAEAYAKKKVAEGEKEFRANSHTQIEGPAGNIDIQSGSAAIAKVDRE